MAPEHSEPTFDVESQAETLPTVAVTRDASPAHGAPAASYRATPRVLPRDANPPTKVEPSEGGSSPASTGLNESSAGTAVKEQIDQDEAAAGNIIFSLDTSSPPRMPSLAQPPVSTSALI